MPETRDVLTPDSLAMLQTIARTGSFAAAARAMGLVPSALTYRVRLIEEALDVLLFDRRSRNARPTPAGEELMREGGRLLDEIEAMANRVKRVATGWETQFTIAVDGVIAKPTMMELCDAFLALAPPTRLRLRDEILSGVIEAVNAGQADLAIGTPEPANNRDVHGKVLGDMAFVFAVAPHHPIASAPEPLSDGMLREHRVVAVADSRQRGTGMSVGLLGGQDVFTVPTMLAKLDAHLRGMGIGFLPEPMARPYIDTGRLVAKATERGIRTGRLHYAWRSTAPAPPGRALQWWLAQLDNATTRRALLDRHASA
ncbi:MAG: LysR family transcriptional regulator [Rhodoferax sp.]|nr:LysR family transcriptional regulator [Rhodoferax sp.]MCB2029735.1 LysR family transcriptional regulator [Rhodoferax sp.]MCB2041706.1 LysR family transcriptional regulator [Rhodoferax sp.]MCP5262432.1 LysR family transcriptional regulator [Rhodoferax sp.]MCW5627575.1 LysR family transcriptional regulator [Rhodoferax sp.]